MAEEILSTAVSRVRQPIVESLFNWIGEKNGIDCFKGQINAGTSYSRLRETGCRNADADTYFQLLIRINYIQITSTCSAGQPSGGQSNRMLIT
jgi:hypothetical protein